jgi:hypothetical protein
LVIGAASVSLLVVPLAVPASAATQPGACKKLVTKTVAGQITANVSSCTPLAATGGSGTGTFKAAPKGATAGSLAIAITWTKNHGTTKGTIHFAKQATLGKCPKVKGEARDKITGTVTGGTGTAFKTIKKGQAITGSVCIGLTSDTLEPGTSLKF